MKTDQVIAAVRDDLLRRSELGIKKYGVTLCEGGYYHRDFLQHAYEEALDLANYLKGAIMKTDDGVAPGLTSEEVVDVNIARQLQRSMELTAKIKNELNAVIRGLPVQDGELANKLRKVVGTV